METLNYLLFILNAVIFFYLGKNKSQEFADKVKKEVAKKIDEFKLQGSVVIDLDEADVEKQEKRGEKELVDIEDVIKANEV